MKIHRASMSRLCGGLAALLLLTAPCAAQEVVTGFEGGPSTGDAFFTPIFDWTLNRANAITFKPSASYLYYNTSGHKGSATEVSSPAVSFGVGYRYTGSDVSFDIGPAIEESWQTKKPAVGKSTEETLTGVAGEADLYWQATALTGINLAATYDAPNRYYWSRATVKERVTDFGSKGSASMSLGADLTDQGATDVRQMSGGGLVEFGFQGGNTALQLRGGYSWLAFSDHTRDQRPYGGVTLYHHF